jgi:hypothetical protein
MAKKKKTRSQAGKHPGAITRKEGQQQPGDRFPRDSYEGGRENPKVF